MLRIMLIAKKRMQEGNIRIKRTLVRKKYEHLFYADKTQNAVNTPFAAFVIYERLFISNIFLTLTLFFESCAKR